MMEKTKITKIKEYYKRKQTEQDPRGQTITVEKIMYRYRQVPYVEGLSRFGHYLLDFIFFYAFSFIIAFGLLLIAAFTGYLHLRRSDYFDLFSWILTWFVLYPGYYLLWETAIQSSPGKLIMRRVVVNEYGEKPAFRQIFIRSVSRLVPFEPFSCFDATGWHDNWSKTYVLRKKDLEELQLQTMVENFDAIPEDTMPQSTEPV
ncbi:MAG: RDD family protein [Bacteroidia bacterium]